MAGCHCLCVAALMLMDSSATETDDENPQDSNLVHVGRRKKRRESDDATVGVAKKRLKRNHKEDSAKKKVQLKTRTVYSDSKVNMSYCSAVVDIKADKFVITD